MKRNLMYTVDHADQNWFSRAEYANNVLGKLRDRMSLYYPDEFSGEFQGSAMDFASVLQKHRLKSKFFIDTQSLKDELQSACFSNYKLFEEDHLKFYEMKLDYISIPTDDYDTHGVPDEFRFSKEQRRALYRARSFIHHMLSKVSYDSRFIDLDYTPGESFFSQKGATSIRQKLGNIEHWTTYDSCLEDTCMLIYRHRGLKRMAKEFIKPHLDKGTVHVLHDLFSDAPNKGYLIFRHLLIKHVLTIVDGARAGTVSKNLEAVRLITVEAVFPLLLQRSVSDPLLVALELADNMIGDHGVDFKLGDGQVRHKRMIAYWCATIDFSNASDSILLALIAFLFPPHWFKLVSRYRPQTVRFSPKDLGGKASKPYWIEPLKVSSMGCGFTFEILSIVMLAFSRVYDEKSSSYGDDVIISNDKAVNFVSLCESVGFIVNKKKTFINNDFRESCGAFFHTHLGYLTTFDFREIKTPVDLIVSANKLFTVAQAGYDHSLMFQKSYEDLLRVVPSLQKGPPPVDNSMYESNFDKYVFVKRYLRKHRENNCCNKLFARYTTEVRDILDGYGYREFSGPIKPESMKDDMKDDLMSNSYDLHDLVVLEIPVFKQQQVPLHKRVSERATYLSHLHAGRVTKDTIRGKGKWIIKKFFAGPCGTLYPIARLRLIRKLHSLNENYIVSHTFHNYVSPWQDYLNYHEGLLLQTLAPHQVEHLS